MIVVGSYDHGIGYCSRLNIASDSIQTVIQNTSVLVQALQHLGHPGSSSALRTTASMSNPTASGNGSQQDRARMEHTLKLTHALQRHVRLKYEMDMDELIRSYAVFPYHLDDLLTGHLRALPGLADSTSKDCRATTYRLLRHTLVDTESVDRLRKQNVDWYIIKLVKHNVLSSPYLILSLDHWQETTSML